MMESKQAAKNSGRTPHKIFVIDQSIMFYGNRRVSKLILKGTPLELAGLTAQKVVLVTKNYIGVPIVCEAVTYEECSQLSHLAKSLVLLVVFDSDDDRIDEEVVTVATSRAMMKTIALIAAYDKHQVTTVPCRGLAEASAVEEAMIDGWLSFIWTSIDLPLQASLSSHEKLNYEEKGGIEEVLNIALQKIESHLAKRKSCLPPSEENYHFSIVASSRKTSSKSVYTLADLSLAATLHVMLDKTIATSALDSEENPNLHSWKQNIDQVLGLVLDTV